MNLISSYRIPQYITIELLYIHVLYCTYIHLHNVLIGGIHCYITAIKSRLWIIVFNKNYNYNFPLLKQDESDVFCLYILTKY